MRKMNQRKKVVILTSLILLLILVVYISGIFISSDDIKGSYLNAKEPPSIKHIFGTDALGRDLFLRTLKGLSVSITVGLSASIISAFIAVAVGILASAGSKRMDALMSWIIDLVMSVPHTILIILISFTLGQGLKGLVTGIAATHWCTLSRLIRSEVMEMRSSHYIALSRKMGKKTGWIIRNHLLPHFIPQLITGLVLMFPHAILHEAAISFLGFGLSPEGSSIGIILSESMRYISTGMWWAAVLPGLTLTIIVLLFDRLGNYLTMILDPADAQK